MLLSPLAWEMSFLSRLTSERARGHCMGGMYVVGQRVFICNNAARPLDLILNSNIKSQNNQYWCSENPRAVDEVSWHVLKLASVVLRVHTESQGPCVLKEQ